jgi:hypothetical protein
MVVTGLSHSERRHSLLDWRAELYKKRTNKHEELKHIHTNISCQTLVLAVCRRCGKTPDQTRVVKIVRISPTFILRITSENPTYFGLVSIFATSIHYCDSPFCIYCFVSKWVRFSAVYYLETAWQPIEKYSSPINKIMPIYLLSNYVRTYLSTPFPKWLRKWPV